MVCAVGVFVVAIMVCPTILSAPCVRCSGRDDATNKSYHIPCNMPDHHHCTQAHTRRGEPLAPKPPKSISPKDMRKSSGRDSRQPSKKQLRRYEQRVNHKETIRKAHLQGHQMSATQKRPDVLSTPKGRGEETFAKYFCKAFNNEIGLYNHTAASHMTIANFKNAHFQITTQGMALRSDITSPHL